MAKPRTRPAPTTTADKAASSAEPLPAPLTDVLDRKWRRTQPYRFPVSDPTEAARELEEAKSVLRTTVAQHPPGDDGQDSAPVVAAQVVRDQSKQRFDACFATITFQAISSRAFHHLVEQHPPKQPGQDWDPETFHPALLAACARDLDLTAEQWAERFDRDEWSTGDRNAIFAAALAPNLAT